MKTTTRVVTCALVALTLLAAGCTKDEAAPIPTTATSPTTLTSTVQPSSASPTPTASPTPSSSAAQQEALVAEASTQLKHAYAELVRAWQQQGGLGPDEEPPKALKNVATGEALASFTRTLRKFSSVQAKWLSGEFAYGPAKDITSSGPKDATVTITMCIDGTGIKSAIGKDKTPSTGRWSLATASFRLESGTLKVYQVNERPDDSCG